MIGTPGRVWFFVAMLAAALGGCSSSDSGSSFAFGKAPEPKPLDPLEFPAKYKTEVADFLRFNLNNPSRLRDGAIGQPVLKSLAGQPQYVTCVRYNQRNVEGQYTGVETKLAIFLGGRLNQMVANNPEICASLAYQRFPEIETMVP